MFFEAAFGICLGCKIYTLLSSQKTQHCPGGTCELASVDRPKLSAIQQLSVALFAGLVLLTWQWVGPSASAMASVVDPAHAASTPTGEAVDPAEQARCKVPEFAKAMGHEAQWKLHNHCH